MKNCLLLILFICCTAASDFQSEKYYVTFVKGIVTIEKTKKDIKVGDILDPNDKLLFANKNAKVSCISPTKGRFNVGPKQSSEGSSELYAILKSNLVPVTSKYSLSTRAVLFQGNDPAHYFISPETQNKILLVENKALLVKTSYKMDKSNFFFIQFTANGTTLTRKIQQTNQELFFNSNTFENAPEMVVLCYQQEFNGKGKSTIIAKFIPVLAKEEALLEQIRLIKQNSALDKKNLQSDISSHLFDNYGKIGTEEISELLLKV